MAIAAIIWGTYVAFLIQGELLPSPFRQTENLIRTCYGIRYRSGEYDNLNCL
jgi:hypothetical protein